MLCKDLKTELSKEMTLTLSKQCTDGNTTVYWWNKLVELKFFKLKSLKRCFCPKCSIKWDGL